MKRSNLPLNGIRAFEAAARHLSFTRAAAEMSVTQAAISHQVKMLEQRLGLPLFRRLPKGLRLTEEGQALLPELGAALDRIGNALDRLSQRGGSVLTVSTLTTFMLTWLVPRLPRFQAAHPEIAVRLWTSSHFTDFDREEVDVGLRVGEGGWSGLVTHKLFEETITPLCGRAHRERLRSLDDLRAVPLLDSGGEDWEIWLRAAGVRDLSAARGPKFDSTKIAVEAAIDGLGVAVGQASLYAEDIAAGRLFQPYPLSVSNGKAYWLVYPPAASDSPKVRAFRDWILTEIGRAA
ncbi:MAG TPA: transcriptional regulator GcvA [Stellaceae bacterium]|nr:transcriptional regulator GcvA [Stellaceae bacterium]